MKILYIEPYYTGSHQQWIEAYQRYSSHKIDILSLPGNKWKWRMHGGAVSLANKFIEKAKIPKTLQKYIRFDIKVNPK